MQSYAVSDYVSSIESMRIPKWLRCRDDVRYHISCYARFGSDVMSGYDAHRHRRKVNAFEDHLSPSTLPTFTPLSCTLTPPLLSYSTISWSILIIIYVYISTP